MGVRRINQINDSAVITQIQISGDSGHPRGFRPPTAGTTGGFRPPTAGPTFYKPGGVRPPTAGTTFYKPTADLPPPCFYWMSFFASISDNARGRRNIRKNTPQSRPATLPLPRATNAGYRGALLEYNRRWGAEPPFKAATPSYPSTISPAPSSISCHPTKRRPSSYPHTYYTA